MTKILERMRERISKFCEEETGMCPEDSSLVSDVLVTHRRPGDEIPRQARAKGRT